MSRGMVVGVVVVGVVALVLLVVGLIAAFLLYADSTLPHNRGRAPQRGPPPTPPVPATVPVIGPFHVPDQSSFHDLPARYRTTQPTTRPAASP